MKKIYVVFLLFVMPITFWGQVITGFWQGNDLIVNRMNQLHTVIDDNKVLLIGGHGTDFVSLNTAEVYDPDVNNSTLLTMNSPHDNASFVKLNDGKILILGGSGDLGIAPGYNVTEIFDESTMTFSLVPASMNYGRMIFGSTVLTNGNVLIAGGWYDEPSATYGELYNPITQTFIVTGALNTPRAGLTMVSTPDGKATVFGGTGIYGSPAFQKIEEYDPVTNQFTAISDYFFPNEPNWSLDYSTKLNTSPKLSDGKYIYVIYNSDSLKYRMMTFDPVTKTFEKIYTNNDFDFPSSTSVLDIIPFDDGSGNYNSGIFIVYSFTDSLGTKLGISRFYRESNYIGIGENSYMRFDYYFSSASVDCFISHYFLSFLVCGGTTLDNFTPVNHTAYIIPNGVGVKEINNKIPTTFTLTQNYPNPFNPSTKIRFSLNTSGNVSLKIYDILGKEITTLVNKYMDAGNYEADFNVSETGKNISSGVYIYQLKLKDKILSNKMMILE
ncbi:MAG: T9SS type A sorting domain-containing protein [bacterium]